MTKKIFLILTLILTTVTKSYASEDNFIINKCRTFDTVHYNQKKKLANNFQAKEEMQTFTVSPMKRFRVHYDTVGKNAVDLLDKTQNGIPDYIDSVCAVFDYVFGIQVINMGMNRPRTDYYEKNDSLYDIYVKELGLEAATYGVTYPFEYYDGHKSFSFIEIDNNYSPEDFHTVYTNNGNKNVRTYNTTGLDGMRVTAAHEFHHAVQFAYGDAGSCPSIYEMSAVCMELLVYPNIDDYLMYVNAIMTDINRYNFGENYNKDHELSGYSYGIFFYMITKKYGEESIKKYWEIIEKGTYCYEAIEELFVSYNSSLAEEWNEFLEWIYYSGENTINEKYFYPISKKFKPLKPLIHKIYKEPTLDVNVLTPYELVYSRFINSSNNNFIAQDTVDIIFTNVDTKGVIARSKYEEYSTIECTALTSHKQIDDGKEIFNNYWLKIFSASNDMKYLLNLKAGGQIFTAASVFPQPYQKNKDEFLFFPISDDVIIGEKLNLTIYDANLKFVDVATLEATVENGNRIIKYLPEKLKAGVYTYTVGKSVVHLFGKFAIK